MDVVELMKTLIDILADIGNVQVYIERPEFNDGEYDGQSLEGYWHIDIDENNKDHHVIIRP